MKTKVRPDKMILFDVGWMFFAFWMVVVFAVGVAAFGRDFFPQQQPAESVRKLGGAKTAAARSASR